MGKIKRIEINLDKCTGCRACEVVCSAYHAATKYNPVSTARSRIRVSYDEEADLFVPVLAGPHTEAECDARRRYTINGRTYGNGEDCLFCPVSCPSRELFKEPDSGLPLKCDLCGDPPPPEGPLCIAWCLDDALTIVEIDEGDQEHA